MDPLLLSIADCCRLIGLGRTKFYELVASGAIPLRKVGKKSLISAADLKRWAEALPIDDAKAARGRTSEIELPR
jgi:excisionase family DNA binding protein